MEPRRRGVLKARRKRRQKKLWQDALPEDPQLTLSPPQRGRGGLRYRKEMGERVTEKREGTSNEGREKED